MAENSDKDIVITGYQAITPLGDAESTWERVLKGEKGFTNIRDRFPENTNGEFCEAEIAGVVSDEIFDILSDPMFTEHRKTVREWARVVRFSTWAGAHAMQRADLFMQTGGRPAMELDPAKVDSERVGVFMGSGIGGAFELVEGYKRMLKNRPIQPSLTMRVLPERVASVPSLEFGTHGPMADIAGACSTGNMNIVIGSWALQLGHADVMLVGGAESCLTPEILGAFDGIQALDKEKDPSNGSRAFDETRGGFVQSEGAGALVLETRRHAEERGVEIHGELIGYGMTADSHHNTAPDPDARQANRAMDQAMAMAGPKIDEDEQGYINAHGTATPLGDEAELYALSQVKAIKPERVYVSSTKEMMGHLIGGAGAVESIICLLALKHGIVPPTTAKNPIPETRQWRMPPQATSVPNLRWALNNSFGFGGYNYATVYRRD